MSGNHFPLNILLAVFLVVFGMYIHTPKCDGEENDGDFMDRADSCVGRVLYDLSATKVERTSRAQMHLSALINSSDRVDRLAAAFANGEYCELLNRDVVLRNFRKQICDSDHEVRYLALWECCTCTGYGGWFVPDFLPYIKLHRNDPDTEVRKLARGIYSSFTKSPKKSK